MGNIVRHRWICDGCEGQGIVLKKLFVLFLLASGCASAELRSYSCTVKWHDGIIGDQTSYWALNAYSSRSAESQLKNFFPDAKSVDCE